MSIDLAIAQLEDDIKNLGQGTPSQPKHGTAEWYRLRALAIGLSCLRELRAKKVADDPDAAERHYRGWLREAKAESRP